VASKNASIDDRPLVKQWLWPLRIAFWVLAIGLGLWVYTIMASSWWARDAAPEAPVQHQLQVLEGDLDTLARVTPQLFSPSTLARWIGDTLHEGLVKGFVGAARALMNPPTAKSRSHFSETSAVRTQRDPGGEYVHRATQEAGADWDHVVVGTYVFATRTAYFAAALPLIALALAVGFVDGLVARAKRKAAAGQESAGLYHRAKLGLSFALITGYLICLGLPALPQTPGSFVLLALVIGGLVRLQAATYKKYL